MATIRCAGGCSGDAFSLSDEDIGLSGVADRGRRGGYGVASLCAACTCRLDDGVMARGIAAEQRGGDGGQRVKPLCVVC